MVCDGSGATALLNNVRAVALLVRMLAASSGDRAAVEDGTAATLSATATTTATTIRNAAADGGGGGGGGNFELSLVHDRRVLLATPPPMKNIEDERPLDEVADAIERQYTNQASTIEHTNAAA